MVSRRDLCVAAVASVVTLAATAGTRAAAPVIGSTIFDWNSFKEEAEQDRHRSPRRAGFRPPPSTSSRFTSPRSTRGRRRTRRTSTPTKNW